MEQNEGRSVQPNMTTGVQSLWGRTVSCWQNLYKQFLAYWQSAGRKKQILIYICVYTVIFGAAFSIAYSTFYLHNFSFVWHIDGTTQHLPILVYVGNYVRRLVHNLLRGTFTLPMFDINIGMGDDVLGFLSSQGATDPLMLLSAFVPVRYCEHLYAFLDIFRIYLAGLSFSLLCFYFGKRAMHTLIGSMVYCFNGYSFWSSTRHAYFLNPMILLPLLIVGVDKILKKEKPWFFIFAMVYASLCGFYHLYMMTIMIVIYAAVRFFDLYEKKRVVEFLSAVGRGISGYLLGIGLTAFLLLPAIAEFFTGNRVGYSNYTGTYPGKYYLLRMRGLFSGPGDWDDVALAVIVLFAFVLLFRSQGKRSLKIFASISFVFLMSSICGLFMNGFQYASNRWTFGLVLLAAYVVVEKLPQLLNLSQKQQTECIVVLVLYMLLCMAVELGRRLKSGHGIIYSPVLFVFLMLMLMVLLKPKGNGSRVKNGCTFRKCVLCLLLVIMNVGVNGIYTYAPSLGNWVRTFKKRGSEIKGLLGAIERELRPYLANSPQGRGDGSWFVRNRTMVWRIPGMVFFSSTYNGNVIDFWHKIENSGTLLKFDVYDTQQRTIINTLLSGKYQAETKNQNGYIPYGYKRIKKTKNGRLIYENTYALPWGYTYDKAVSYSQMDALNAVQKQQAMLQAIALDEKVTSTELESRIVLEEKRLPYEITYKNCEWKDGKLVLLKEDAAITLKFDMPAHSEGYVRLNQFDVNSAPIRRFAVAATCGNVTRQSWASTPLWYWYFGRKNYLFNLGYSEQKRNSLTITFPWSIAGTYPLNDIELYALPMANYPACVEALRAEPLENIKWGMNSLTGTVDLSKDKILCVSLPHKKGWSAFVDGEKRDILRGNYMFMAIPLKAGHHDIKLCYSTPGLKLGSAISALCVCITAGMYICDRRGRKKLQKQNSVQDGSVV